MIIKSNVFATIPVIDDDLRRLFQKRGHRDLGRIIVTR